jgi:hypothetical protein
MSDKPIFLEELNLAIIVKEKADYSVDYEVYKAYEQINGFELDELVVKGYVKWDGCSNWEFSNLLHFCSKEEIENLSVAMRKCWDLTAELCPNWLS